MKKILIFVCLGASVVNLAQYLLYPAFINQQLNLLLKLN